MTTPTLPATEVTSFITDLETAFAHSNRDFARAYYLFATARLEETFNSTTIFDGYPLLTSVETFYRIQALFDAHPNDDQIRRLFTSVLDFYTGSQLSTESDDFENTRSSLSINVESIGIIDDNGLPIDHLLYEDVAEWLKKLDQRHKRLALYDAMANAYSTVLTPKFISLFNAQNQLMADLGYTDLVAFYSQTSGHNLPQMGAIATQLLQETESLYSQRISAFYETRTGLPLSEAKRADIAYVFHGPSAETAAVDAQLPKSRLVRLAEDTFDQLGLGFSTVAKTVDFKNKAQYTDAVAHHHQTLSHPENQINELGTPSGVIWLDVTHRPGKNARAYVYPAVVAREIYLSVKPEGGLEDYATFLHEAGHALHFAFEDSTLPYSQAMLGNNSVTEAYAYLFQNLVLNRHWLQATAGLSALNALTVVRHGALNDLYMLRRYCSKLLFELALFKDSAVTKGSLEAVGERYAALLTAGTTFTYDAAGWARDVDAGFYVADYFTAWTLETQLRQYLATHFGTPQTHGEDWFTNPKAGAFLRSLWAQGNLTPQALATTLGYDSPNDISPLLTWMNYNLAE